MTIYNTNLASEFYVLSMLHRLGCDASLTLGNKKSVDIVVVKQSGDVITIDVKGLAGTTSWPVDNVKKTAKDHFLVFVSFLGKIDDYSISPEVYIVPSTRLAPLVYHSPNGRRQKYVGCCRYRLGEKSIYKKIDDKYMMFFYNKYAGFDHQVLIRVRDHRPGASGLCIKLQVIPFSGAPISL